MYGKSRKLPKATDVAQFCSLGFSTELQIIINMYVYQLNKTLQQDPTPLSSWLFWS